MRRRRALSTAIVLVLGAATTTAAVDLIDFARCLSRAGATFYTAAWCPHCRRQIEMFGRAYGYLRSVDCTNGCDGVTSYPTWTFRDGSRLSGVASFDELGRRTSCRLGGSNGDERDDDASPQMSGGPATRRRQVGGAVIIDVGR